MSKDPPQSDDNKNKRDFRKVTSILSDVMQFYYVLIPLIIALIVLGIIESQQKIPELESTLFDPSFKIGLYFVIIASLAGFFLLFNSKLAMKKLRDDIEQIKNDLYERKKSDKFQKIKKIQKENKAIVRIK